MFPYLNKSPAGEQTNAETAENSVNFSFQFVFQSKMTQP